MHERLKAAALKAENVFAYTVGAIFALGLGIAKIGLLPTIAIVIFLAFILLRESVSAKIDEWAKRRAPCSHGIRGGGAHGCVHCVQEQKEIEEKEKRERELRHLREKIRFKADELQRDERWRLCRSLIPDIDELRSLHWKEFENVVAATFDRLGYSVEQTPYTKDHGRDAILTKDGKRFLLECKRYKAGNFSGRRDLQVLHSNIIRDRAVCGFFVTAGAFTKDAIEFSKTAGIELIDQDGLVRLIFDSKPDPTEDDTYRSMCQECGEVVSHHLRTPRTVLCPKGHQVDPTLDIESVILPSVQRDGNFVYPQLVRKPPAKLVASNSAVRGEARSLKSRSEGSASRRAKERANKSFRSSLVVTQRNSAEPISNVNSDANRRGIQIGDRVTIKYLDEADKLATYTLSNSQNDPASGVLSVTSPLGRQLLSLSEGDATEFEANGHIREVSIVRVER
jgi:transcription elongation GreA/GreB family factor